jgi:hypothetical protein
LNNEQRGAAWRRIVGEKIDIGAVEDQPKPKVAGRVWRDDNGDGLQQQQEPGMQDALVTLYRSDDTVFAYTDLDADGFYSFTDVAPGEYYVKFDIYDSELSLSPKNVGPDDAIDSDVNDNPEPWYLSGYTDDFAVDGPGTLLFDAGVVPPPPLPGMVSGLIWNDTNADGIQSGEGLRSGLYYKELRSAAGELIAVDYNNPYTFADVPPGDYYVQFLQYSGEQFTRLDAGDNDAVDSDADPVLGRTAVFTVTSDRGVNHVDAGIIPVGGSIAAGSPWELPPRVPTDPDVPDSGIRLVKKTVSGYASAEWTTRGGGSTKCCTSRQN